MNAGEKTPRFPYKKFISIDEDGMVTIRHSGEFLSKAARIFRPSSDEMRRMLRELRMRCSWSQSALASVLGAPKDTLRRWEDGTRKPSATAARLIWFLHSAYVRDELLGDLFLFDFVSWGLRQGGAELQLHVIDG
jgi:DNA-binding transcriptional regulator YiaG